LSAYACPFTDLGRAYAQLLVSGHSAGNHEARYYQEIATKRTVDSVIRGKKRVLLVMAN
jgi:type I site-specific restriction endonuclease